MRETPQMGVFQQPVGLTIIDRSFIKEETMILASQEMIRKWTDAGAWGNKTFIDYFKEHVRTQPDKVCLVDPLNKEALVGLKPERLLSTGSSTGPSMPWPRRSSPRASIKTTSS
jgi:hypothetical protein